jgi:hypothetical protein
LLALGRYPVIGVLVVCISTGCFIMCDHSRLRESSAKVRRRFLAAAWWSLGLSVLFVGAHVAHVLR